MDGLSGSRVTGPNSICQRDACSSAYGIGADRPGYVLELLFAAILEANLQLAFDFVIDLLRDEDTAGIGDALQPDRNIDPITVEVTVLPNDDVAEVEPDAQPERTAARGEMILHLDRASRGGKGACELGECTITGRFDKSAFVPGDTGFDQLLLEPLELGVGGFLGALHQRRVTDHIGGQDCC